MNLNELAAEIHNTAVDKGWWDDTRDVGMVLALIHSEVSEVLEDYRNGLGLTETVYRHPDESQCKSLSCYTTHPAGVPIEMADIIIRVLDACAGWGIDIDAAMAEKIAYNRTRPHKHGGKRA